MNWKVILALLTCNVLFMSASYTMIIPFLPMYLTHELGVDEASVNLWAGLAFSVTFLISAVMAPIWGRIGGSPWETPHGDACKPPHLDQLPAWRHCHIA